MEEVGSEGNEEDEALIVDFGSLLKFKKRKEKPDKFDVAVEQAVLEEPNMIDKKPVNNQRAPKVNLNEVEFHDPFTYQFMLERVAEIVNERTGGLGNTNTGLKTVEPHCTRTKTKSTW